MHEYESETIKSGRKAPGKRPEPRTPRSIRFSDAEWAGVQKAAQERGMTPAELVRHAAVGFSAGRLSTATDLLPPDLAAQIERIYRGVYLLSTLKRDELILGQRHEDLERIAQAANESQAKIRKEASESCT